MPMFWNTLMGINSFIIIPAALMFLIYSLGHAIIQGGDWAQFAAAVLIFGVSIIAEIILAIMDDA